MSTSAGASSERGVSSRVCYECPFSKSKFGVSRRRCQRARGGGGATRPALSRPPPRSAEPVFWGVVFSFLRRGLVTRRAPGGRASPPGSRTPVTRRSSSACKVSASSGRSARGVVRSSQALCAMRRAAIASRSPSAAGPEARRCTRLQGKLYTSRDHRGPRHRLSLSRTHLPRLSNLKESPRQKRILLLPFF